MDSPERAQPRCSRCAGVILYIGIAEALVFTVLKAALGLSSGSRALMAASLYSIQDLISSLAAVIGMKISARPPDRNHPYGHGKAEYLMVILMSLMILLGVVVLTVTALDGFLDEAATTAEAPAMLALWVALVCGVACWLLCRFYECAGRRLNSPALTSCAEHMHSDCVSSVAVTVSVIGAKLGHPAVDHAVAILEAVHVVFISGRVLGSAINGLMDTAADPRLLERLKRVIGEVEPVKRIRRTTARWSGQTLLAQIDVEVPGQMKLEEAERLRAGIRQAVGDQVCGRNETLIRISPASAT